MCNVADIDEILSFRWIVVQVLRGLKMKKRNLNTSDVRLICLFVFIVILVIFGAAVFHILEDPWEAHIRHKLRTHLQIFREENACVSGIVHCNILNVTYLCAFIRCVAELSGHL